jgi:hypothetical protein
VSGIAHDQSALRDNTHPDAVAELEYRGFAR